MNYKGYIAKLFLRIFVLMALTLALIYTIDQAHITYTVLLSFGLVYWIINMYSFVKKRLAAVDDFFEAVKYRDFSRWFPEDRGPKDIQVRSLVGRCCRVR